MSVITVDQPDVVEWMAALERLVREGAPAAERIDIVLPVGEGRVRYPAAHPRRALMDETNQRWFRMHGRIGRAAFPRLTEVRVIGARYRRFHTKSVVPAEEQGEGEGKPTRPPYCCVQDLPRHLGPLALIDRSVPRITIERCRLSRGKGLRKEIERGWIQPAVDVEYYGEEEERAQSQWG